MLRHFSTLATGCWFLLTGLFFLLCFRAWTSPRHTAEFGCGTVGPYERSPESPEGETYALGKTIFRNNCAACHAGNIKTMPTGPALGGMQERWFNHGGEEALYAWIRNSQQMIQAGENQRAQELWQDWKPTVMNSFENLSDEELAAVVFYINDVYQGTNYISGN